MASLQSINESPEEGRQDPGSLLCNTNVMLQRNNLLTIKNETSYFVEYEFITIQRAYSYDVKSLTLTLFNSRAFVVVVFRFLM